MLFSRILRKLLIALGGALVVLLSSTAVFYGPEKACATSLCDVSNQRYVWTRHVPDGVYGSWGSVAMSFDGQRMAITNGGWNTKGYIYISIDGGTTWTQQAAPGWHKWMQLAMSADGLHITAVAQDADIYTSSDGGTTWTDQAAAGDRKWYGVAMSADGMKIAAVVNNDVNVPVTSESDVHPGDIYTSSDGGATWTDQVAAGGHDWYGIASNADGTQLVAAYFGWATLPGKMLISTDSGVTWNQTATDITDLQRWLTVASNASGSKLSAGNMGYWIYSSDDYGATWHAQSSSTRNIWHNIAMSADGQREIAVMNNWLYETLDGGTTWIRDTAQFDGLPWEMAAMNADGTKVVAAVMTSSAGSDGIWTGVLDTIPNTPLSLGGTDVITGATITNERPTFNFTLSDPDTSDTVKYEIIVSKHPDFSLPEIDYTSALAAQGSASFTAGQAAGGGSYTAGAEGQELEEGTYYWEVKTIDAPGLASGFAQANSGAIAFVVEEAPPTPGTPEAEEELKEHPGWRPAAYNEMRPPVSFQTGGSGGGTSAPATGTPETPVAILPEQPEQAMPSETATNTPQFTFTKTLKLGVHDPDVLALQKYLNSHDVAVTSAGPGSAGQETDYFGSATRQAVIRFQELNRADILVPNGLSKGTGLFGPATIQYVNTHP